MLHIEVQSPLESERKKRGYEPLQFKLIEMDSTGSLLNSSIVASTMIESVGQETGPTIDFSADTETFNHDWEGGSSSY